MIIKVINNLDLNYSKIVFDTEKCPRSGRVSKCRRISTVRNPHSCLLPGL